MSFDWLIGGYFLLGPVAVVATVLFLVWRQNKPAAVRVYACRIVHIIIFQSGILHFMTHISYGHICKSLFFFEITFQYTAIIFDINTVRRRNHFQICFVTIW